MARKKLLTEGEIRQFMKLANLGPLPTQRLQEMGMPPGMSSGLPGNRDEPEMDMEVGMEDDLGAEDMEAELDAEEMPEAEGEMSLSDDEAQAIIDLADRLRDAMGGEGGEEEMDMEMDMGPEGGEEEFEADVEEEMPGARDAMYEDKGYTAKKEKAGKDKRKGADRRGAEGTKKKTSGKKRGTKKGDDAYVNENEELEELATGRGYDPPPRRTPKKLRRGGPEEEGPMAPLIDEPSEVLSGTEHDPEEEAKERERRRTKSWRPSSAGRREEGRDYDDALVAEVARRVAARMRTKETKDRKDEMVDHLAERIMQRLTK